MVPQEVWMDVKLLHRQGASIRKIARVTGLSRVTVRRMLAQPAPKGYGPRAPRPTKLDAWLPRLEALIMERPHARATVLRGLIAGEGYTGCYESVKCWVRKRRREESARRRACVRFETGPGIESQFDWKGPVHGLLLDEPETGIHFFRLLLAIPAFLVSGSLYGAMWTASFFGWFVALVRGEMPDGIRNLGAFALRYGGQVSAYAFVLTDRYPYAGPSPDPASP